MKVYIVMKGERGMGGEITDVCASKDLAKDALQREVTAANYFKWTINDDGTYASGGCDWIEVKEYEVVE